MTEYKVNGPVLPESFDTPAQTAAVHAGIAHLARSFIWSRMIDNNFGQYGRISFAPHSMAEAVSPEDAATMGRLIQSIREGYTFSLKAAAIPVELAHHLLAKAASTETENAIDSFLYTLGVGLEEATELHRISQEFTANFQFGVALAQLAQNGGVITFADLPRVDNTNLGDLEHIHTVWFPDYTPEDILDLLDGMERVVNQLSTGGNSTQSRNLFIYGHLAAAAAGLTTTTKQRKIYRD